MHSKHLPALFFAASISATGAAAAQAAQGLGAGRESFVGVFYPVVTGVSADPQRCPDADHPLLMNFTGTAHTSLGSATFTQAHCINTAQTSFNRGEKRITFGNGETLWASYQGRLAATPTTGSDGKVVVEAIWRNTGGTGSLRHARGVGSSAGTVDVVNGASVITEHGRL